ncbi:uncharacterized protein MYCFIDRAFT_193070 [Pseudocercospora fijiensis CIRAD86]|uniref:Trichothecene 3-O-acetyltransferase-like N-terminal domain-containing protein n=1 Tax=Pseudocercospora fijiensis (strain CIRAD86) TaxID=383855 RepID=N1Q887_PSEFD|nr:uncharacterized protein MYCFIDRAFT_193070 [Pseudocercospora fijiensis CIRAD86]EME89059.1 hypothetical protein MYCFIDRAFT_193070 [Pseudocercospora fijiensis CIRAD86]
MAGVTYRLSTIDQSSIRTYSRVCLCFACSNEDRERVAEALTANVQRTVSHLPILAGKVHPITATSRSQEIREDSVGAATSSSAFEESSNLSGKDTGLGSNASTNQRGRLEIRVELEDVERLRPTLNFLDEDVHRLSFLPRKTRTNYGQAFPSTYSDLMKGSMPASAFLNTSLTPVPDMPDPAEGSNPVFAAKANFINGGVLVAIYIHHSVADSHGVATIIRHLSISADILPPQELTLQSLHEDAVEQSRLRDRLSGSRGVKSNAAEHPEYQIITGSGRARRLSLAPSYGSCHVLSFDLQKLSSIKTMLVERCENMLLRTAPEFSTKDCLVAILWKVLTRARCLSRDDTSGQSSSLLMPISIRDNMEPIMSKDYYGNASLYAHSTAPVIQLCLPIDVGTMLRTTELVHRGTKQMHEIKVRSAIALINDREDVRSVNHPAVDFQNDVFVTDWSSVLEADLGLGLGAPDYVRKVSRQHSSYGCILLPAKSDEGVWEVLVQLTEDAMEKLLEDPALQPLLLRVA